MGRGFRPWWLALGLSLLLHAGLLGGLWWTLPQQTHLPAPSVFEARLVSVDTPVPVPTSRRQTPTLVKSPAPSQPAVEKVTPPAAMPVEAPVEAAANPTVPQAIAETGMNDTARQPVPPPAVAAAPVDVPPPPLNPFPRRLDLHYDVHYGLAAGEQTLVWVNEGEHYTLTSVASATGLAGLFYRGRFVQTSRGRITPHGLQPEEFWDQRGDKRSSARFDAAQGLISLSPAKGAPRHFDYQGEVQDALSLFFQFALTAPPLESRLTYRVFNGKKLRDYRYEVRGEVMLDTALGVLRTLHLARTADDDGRFEAWLAIDRHYLPVRVLRSDEKGNEVALQLRSIAP